MQERNGSVHVWDVASRESVGQIWAATGSVESSQPWYDPEDGTVWVASGRRLLELSLDPERWIENACACPVVTRSSPHTGLSVGRGTSLVG
jgi:hypothetical protein